MHFHDSRIFCFSGYGPPLSSALYSAFNHTIDDPLLKQDINDDDRNDRYEYRRENKLPRIAVLSCFQLGKIQLQCQRCGLVGITNDQEREQVVIPDPHSIDNDFISGITTLKNISKMFAPSSMADSSSEIGTFLKNP